MDENTAQTPIHLWIVGGLATLWNAFGCYDYFMTRTRGECCQSLQPLRSLPFSLDYRQLEITLS